MFLNLVEFLKNHKWNLIALAVIFSLSYIAIYIAYPKSDLVMVYQIKGIDKVTGLPQKENTKFFELRQELARYGVNLRAITQESVGRDESSEKPNLEALLEGKIDADFAISNNTGVKLPEEVTKKFSSMGASSQTSILFFSRAGEKRIKNLKDLVGKKIVFWSSPEGHDKPLFSSPEAKASIYSNDYYLEELFKLAGVNSKNSKIINVWPNPISLDQDWDVWITVAGMPSKDRPITSQMYAALENGQIQFLQLSDISGIARNLRYLNLLNIPKSTFDVSKNWPPVDIQALAYNKDVIVKNDIDPGVAFILAEALQNVYSDSTRLSNKNEFPNFSQHAQFEPNKIAEDYYKHGPPFLNKYLPPNLANLVTKLMIILLPILTIIWPLIHFVPEFYEFYVKHKINHWYKDLERLERIYMSATPHDKSELLAQFHEIERGVQNIRLPLMHSHHVQEIFHARAHVELIKQKFGFDIAK